MNPEQSDNSAATAAMITKALGYVENGGKPNVNNLQAGKSGELKSIFQYEPGTWKQDAKEILGSSNVPLTPANESLVTFNKVHRWLQGGKTPEQIFSMWNAGPGEPDAYTGKFSDGHTPSVGVNNKGVKFNVPAYVRSGMHYLQQFQGEPHEVQSIADSGEAPPSSQQVPFNPPAPTAKNSPKPPVKSKSKMGLISGMLPQYGQYL